VGDVGVLQLPQEPRLTHHQLERLSVDINTFDNTRYIILLRGAGGGGVRHAKGGAERALKYVSNKIQIDKQLNSKKRTLPMRQKVFMAEMWGMKLGR